MTMRDNDANRVGFAQGSHGNINTSTSTEVIVDLQGAFFTRLKKKVHVDADGKRSREFYSGLFVLFALWYSVALTF